MKNAVFGSCITIEVMNVQTNNSSLDFSIHLRTYLVTYLFAYQREWSKFSSIGKSDLSKHHKVKLHVSQDEPWFTAIL